MNIESSHEVTQVHERVFQIGDLSSTTSQQKYLIINIINILNKGNKFIPTYFFDNSTANLFLDYIFQDFLVHFNKKLFLYKVSKNWNREQFSYSNTQSQIELNLNNLCDKIIKNLNFNKSNKDRKFPLQKETIELEFEFFKNIDNLVCRNDFNNITLKEYKSIKNFIKLKPFKICQCDKNVGIALLSHDTYSELSTLHLNVSSNFLKLENNPLEQTQKIITEKLTDLKLNHNISKRLFNSLILKDFKLGSFSILPKLHKTKFGTRPIINSIKHPSSNLSQFVDYILQPFVQSSGTFIKDSQHLIQDLENLELGEEEVKLCSFDFESLYSNINLEDALIVITDFMKDKISNIDFTVIGFHHILKLVFNNNVFSFNKLIFYKQITGIAMGSKCGPSIANIYLYCLEKNFILIHKPIFYRRYIDDIFAIFRKVFNTLILINFFKYLKLNEICSEIVNFLDLNISQDRITRKIKFSLYIKPTNTFSYLMTESNHPEFIKNNLPKGILIRIRRICTSIIDFYFFANKTALQLETRGYDMKIIHKIINIVSNLDRNTLLKYKNKITNLDQKQIIISSLYDKHLNSLNSNLIKCIDNLSSIYLIPNLFKLVNRMQPNIGAITINTIPSQLFNKDCKQFRYKRCGLNYCKICFKSIGYKNLYKKDKLVFFVKSDSTCNSKEVVYLIYCKLCGEFYVGETSRKIGIRINEHLTSIEKFNPFIKFTSVSRHFNLVGHTIKDFSFFIYDIDLEVSLRKYTERKIIYIMLMHGFKLMNDDFPSLFSNINFIFI